MNQIFIINLKGEKELFSPQKVFNSARRAGASKKLARRITNVIEKEVCPGMKTSYIFREILRMLSGEDFKSALKFNLKRAMRNLGPSGFPFEKFISRVFANLGYRTKSNVHLEGKCISNYEIDLLAQNKEKTYIGECKFHSKGGERVDLDVALYNYARFLDIKSNSNSLDLKGTKLKAILITNTKFTSQVVAYSKCVGVDLLGWKMPLDNGLEKIIQDNKLYPITILPSFTNHFFGSFAQNGIMLAKDLLSLDLDSLSKKLSLDKGYLIPLVKEAKVLLS